MPSHSTDWFDCPACGAEANHQCDQCGDPTANQDADPPVEPELHWRDSRRGCPPHLYVPDGPFWESVCHSCQTSNRTTT